MNNLQRIGFACKFLEAPEQLLGKRSELTESLNTKTTTVAWLNRQTRDQAEERLWDIMRYNVETTNKLIRHIAANKPKRMRMIRLSSDMLPVYTEAKWRSFWKQPDVVLECERRWAQVGQLARDLDVRLSFHPGQFCVLASETADIVQRSIEEFEYHADMARWMGYGHSWHDHGFKINVHISGRAGAQGIVDVIGRLSPEARNLLTIENDEMSHGLDTSLVLANKVALVLDIHHHWVRTGEYIQAEDDRVKKVAESWRGIRPTMHYSLSREDLLVGHDPNVLPNMDSLLASGFKKQKLRAPSDDMWNIAANRWALTFSPMFDIMVECKLKNLGTETLLKHANILPSLERWNTFCSKLIPFLTSDFED